MGCYYVGCVNEPFVHGLTWREAGQVEVWRRPNELIAEAILPATRDSVNTIYYQIKDTQTEERFCACLYPVPRIAHSSSGSAVSFSSAPTMKRFPLSRCASAIQTGRPSRSTANLTGLSDKVASPVCQRSLPISAKRANFFRELVESYTGGFGRVPQRNVRIGNFANAL